MSEFNRPDFTHGELELRFENDEVCIYGSADGLRQLSNYCISLIEDPAQQHIHLNVPWLLTKKSAKGTIAIFEKPTKPSR